MGNCLASAWLLQGVEIERLGSHSVTYEEEKAANYWARGANGKGESQLKETGKLRKWCSAHIYQLKFVSRVIVEINHGKINPHVCTRHTRNRGFMQGNRRC